MRGLERGIPSSHPPDLTPRTKANPVGGNAGHGGSGRPMARNTGRWCPGRASSRKSRLSMAGSGRMRPLGPNEVRGRRRALSTHTHERRSTRTVKPRKGPHDEPGPPPLPRTAVAHRDRGVALTDAGISRAAKRCQGPCRPCPTPHRSTALPPSPRPRTTGTSTRKLNRPVPPGCPRRCPGWAASRSRCAG